MSRTQCAACPWRNLDTLRAEFPNIVAHAEAGNLDGWVCHTRCGPCPGARLALRKVA